MLPKHFIMGIMTMLLIFLFLLPSKKAAGQYQLPRIWDPLNLSKSDSLTNEIPEEKDTAIYKDVAFDNIFCILEIEASYPGGSKQWLSFICTNICYPDLAIDSNVQGTVRVQFFVEANGEVTGVEAISGPDLLREEAARVIRKSGRWKPAVRNNKKIKSYKMQAIVFSLSECDDKEACCASRCNEKNKKDLSESKIK